MPLDDRALEKLIEQIDGKIIRTGKDTAERLRVVREPIDLRTLRGEKKRLGELMGKGEPDERELAEMGRGYHPYYVERAGADVRLDQIDAVLRELGE